MGGETRAAFAEDDESVSPSAFTDEKQGRDEENTICTHVSTDAPTSRASPNSQSFLVPGRGMGRWGM